MGARSARRKKVDTCVTSCNGADRCLASKRGRRMPAPLTDAQRATLRAVCDTVVPSIDHHPDPTGHWARKASDLGVEQPFEQMLADFPPEDQAGIGQLLDVLADQGFHGASQLSREQLLRNIALAGP